MNGRIGYDPRMGERVAQDPWRLGLGLLGPERLQEQGVVPAPWTSWKQCGKPQRKRTKFHAMNTNPKKRKKKKQGFHAKLKLNGFPIELYGIEGLDKIYSLI